MVRLRRFIPSLVMLVMCYILYLNMRVYSKLRRNRQHSCPFRDVRSAEECSQLRSLIINSNSMLNQKTLFQTVKGLQECPWEQNQTQAKLLRSQLMTCCSAFESMIVTQENTPTRHVVSLHNEQMNITEKTWNSFPKKSPLLHPLRRCAMVANGGILTGSSCGEDIDQADFVFRMNLPPLNRMNDVGTKTDLVTANPTILINNFGSLTSDRQPFVDAVKLYGSAQILIPAFSFSGHVDVSMRALEALEEFGIKVVFLNPDYLRSLASFWTGKGVQFHLMSPGFILVSAALQICDQVTLYGFWPFDEDLNEGPIPDHYYDNVPSPADIHAMPDELYHYLEMHVHGTLRLNVAQC